MFDANYIASALNECKIEMEDWITYAIELEAQGQLEDADFALNEAILYEEDVAHWVTRLEEWMVPHHATLKANTEHCLNLALEFEQERRFHMAEMALNNATEWEPKYEYDDLDELFSRVRLIDYAPEYDCDVVPPRGWDMV